ELFRAPDRDAQVECVLAEDGRYLAITVLRGPAAAPRTDLYVRDLAAGGPARAVVRDAEARFAAGFAGGRLLLHTTWTCPSGRVLLADPRRPGPASWKETVRGRRGATIRAVHAAAGRVFVESLEDSRSRVRAFRLDGTPEGEVAFDAPGTVAALGGPW